MGVEVSVMYGVDVVVGIVPTQVHCLQIPEQVLSGSSWQYVPGGQIGLSGQHSGHGVHCRSRQQPPGPVLYVSKGL